MKAGTASPFRRALSLTAIPLCLPAVIELAVAFSGPSEAGLNALLWVPLFGACLIALAGVLALFLALAGYKTQAKGAALGAGAGLLSLAAAVGLILWVQP